MLSGGRAGSKRLCLADPESLLYRLVKSCEIFVLLVLRMYVLLRNVHKIVVDTYVYSSPSTKGTFTMDKWASSTKEPKKTHVRLTVVPVVRHFLQKKAKSSFFRFRRTTPAFCPPDL